MTEPKIVHLPPREKNPAREPNETWDAGERLFGLEELLLHMPPIRKLHLERGRLKDLVRLYPDMKREFAAPELLPQAVIATAMVRRRMELLLFRSDDQREAGYALVTVCSPYGYVLVHMLTIYPFLRERMLRTNGYRDTGFRFRWNGQPAALYLRPCQSTEDITPVAQLLLRDLYGDLLTPVNARRMIQPEA